jgi:hypothetical protein
MSQDTLYHTLWIMFYCLLGWLISGVIGRVLNIPLYQHCRHVVANVGHHLEETVIKIVGKLLGQPAFQVQSRYTFWRHNRKIDYSIWLERIFSDLQKAFWVYKNVPWQLNPIFLIWDVHYTWKTRQTRSIHWAEANRQRNKIVSDLVRLTSGAVYRDDIEYLVKVFYPAIVNPLKMRFVTELSGQGYLEAEAEGEWHILTCVELVDRDNHTDIKATRFYHPEDNSKGHTLRSLNPERLLQVLDHWNVQTLDWVQFVW